MSKISATESQQTMLGFRTRFTKDIGEARTIRIDRLFSLAGNFDARTLAMPAIFLYIFIE